MPSDLNDFMNIKPILHKKTFQELSTDELYELLRVRSEVFVVEQNCVYQDMDGDDVVVTLRIKNVKKRKDPKVIKLF